MHSSNSARTSRSLYVPPPLRNKLNDDSDNPFSNCAFALGLHSMTDGEKNIDYVFSGNDGGSYPTICVPSKSLLIDEENAIHQNRSKRNGTIPALKKTSNKSIYPIDDQEVYQIESYRICPMADGSSNQVISSIGPPLSGFPTYVDSTTQCDVATEEKSVESFTKNMQTEQSPSKEFSDKPKETKRKKLQKKFKENLKYNNDSFKLPSNTRGKMNNIIKEEGMFFTKDNIKKRLPKSPSIPYDTNTESPDRQTPFIPHGDSAAPLEKQEMLANKDNIKQRLYKNLSIPCGDNMNSLMKHKDEAVTGPTPKAVQSRLIDSSKLSVESSSNPANIEIVLDNWEDDELLSSNFVAACSVSQALQSSSGTTLEDSSRMSLHTTDSQTSDSDSKDKSAQKILNLETLPVLIKERRSEPRIDYTEYEHVIELYDFPPNVETQDLYDQLHDFLATGLQIKWVDDTHCLAVFNTREQAEKAVEHNSELLFKMRSLVDAAPGSKWKLAKSPGDWMLPYKSRPQTSNLAARRMISHHLGLRSNITPREKKSEQHILTQVKEQRRSRQKAEEDAWNGTF